ncbi:MAG: glycosyltransferase family 2 protein [Flavobacterium sp.]
MATYNRAHLISETLVSIQNQTYTYWECLIVDDGSTDNTLEVLQDFIVNDSRFQYHKRPTSYQKGLPGCRNFGLDNVRGEYLIFFDDDDIVHPENLKIAVKGIIESKASFLHYQKQSFSTEKPVFDSHIIEYDSWISKKDIYEILTGKIGLASCTVLWHKKCFEQIRFIESLQYAEEWECYTRIISEDFSGIKIKNILYYNRKHSNSNTYQFYKGNTLRTQSKQQACLHIVKNLKKKNLINYKLLRYFIHFSSKYNRIYFHEIIDALNLGKLANFYWSIYFNFMPIKFKLYKFFKKGFYAH